MNVDTDNVLLPILNDSTGLLNIPWAYALVGFMIGSIVGGELMRKIGGSK